MPIRLKERIKTEIAKIEIFILSDDNSDLSDGEMLDHVIQKLAELKSNITEY